MAARGDDYNNRRASTSDADEEEKERQEEKEEMGDGEDAFTDAEDGGIVKSHTEDVSDQAEADDSDGGGDDAGDKDADTNRRRVRIRDEHAFEIKELRVSMQCDITAYLSPNSVQELGRLVAQSNEELLSDNMKKLSEALVELEAQHQREIGRLTANHKQEIDDLSANHKQEIDDLSANHRKELEHTAQRLSEQEEATQQLRQQFDLDLQEQLIAQRAEMLQDAEEKMLQLNEHHASEVDRLKVEVASKDQDNVLRHQQDLNEMEAELSAVYKNKLDAEMALLQKARDERQNVLEAKIETLTQQIASSSDEISSRHAAEIEQLRSEFAADKIVALNSVRDELEAKHSEEMAQLKQEHENTLHHQQLLQSRADESNVENSRELQEKYEQDLAQLQQAHKQLEDEYTRRMADLEAVYQTLKTEQQDTVTELQQSKEVVAHLEQSQKELVDKHSRDMHNLREKHESELREKVAAAEIKLEEITNLWREKHDNALAECEKLQQIITEKTGEMEQIRESLQAEHRDALDKLNNELNSSKTATEQDIAEQHRQEIAALNASHARELQEFQTSTAHKIEEMKALNDKTMQEKHSNEVAEMQAAYQKLKTTSDDREIEFETLKSKYDELVTNTRVDIDKKTSEIGELQNKLEHQLAEHEHFKQAAVTSQQSHLEQLKSDLQQHYEAKFQEDAARQRDALAAELKSVYEAESRKLEEKFADKHAQDLAHIEEEHQRALQLVREQCAEEYRINIAAELAAVRNALELEFKTKLDAIERQNSLESRSVVFDKQLGDSSSDSRLYTNTDHAQVEMLKATQSPHPQIDGGAENDSSSALEQLQAKHAVAIETLKSDYESRTKMLEDALVAERQVRQEAVASLEEYRKQNDITRPPTNGGQRLIGDEDDVDGGGLVTSDTSSSSNSKKRVTSDSLSDHIQASTAAQLGTTESRDIWDMLEELPSSYENLLNPASSRSGTEWTDCLFQMTDDGFESAGALSPKEDSQNSTDGFVGGTGTHDLFSMSTSDSYVPPNTEVLRLRAELEAKKAHINELNSYIEQLLVKVMDATPRLLQAGQLTAAVK